MLVSDSNIYTRQFNYDRVLAGNYTLYIGVDKGKVQTSPANPLTYNINLQQYQQVTSKDFGIAPAFTLKINHDNALDDIDQTT